MTSTKQKRIERVYPLSPMQSGMFFHALKNENSRAYFEQMTFRLKGNISSDLLQRSFDIIFARYDILRTVFRADKLEEPMQFVLRQRNFKLYFEDISHLGETEKNAYVEEFAEKDREKDFDLLRDILMRASLFKMGADVYTLVWSFHHILMDGWCLGIIYEELIFVYGLLKAGRPIELEPAAPYVNYINWLEQQDKKKGLEYWENYLEGYEQGVGIPGLKPGDRHYQLEEYDVVIAAKASRALNTIAGKNRVTVNTLFQTLWGILLQKYTNSNDVVFGAVVSGRPPEIKGIERMVGLFLNTIPIRIKNRGEDNFLQLLKKVQEDTAQSKNYEYVSLAEVQAKTALKGNPIDHILAFENLPGEESGKASVSIGGGLDDRFAIQDVRHHSRTNYDLNVIIIPGDSIVVRLNYNSRIVEKEFIRKLGLHLKEIIKQVLDRPDILVKEIGIITEEERQRVVFDFNQTAADYPADKTIHELFVEQAEKTPDNTAAAGHGCKDAWMHGNISITFRELNEKSGQLAHLLREKGVGPDTVVALKIKRSIEMIIGILGILKAGGAYLPIDADYPQERIDYMMKDSQAGVLVSEVSKVSEVSEVSGGAAAATHPNNLCYLIYTSGTTGKPKGVMLEHGNLVNLIRYQFNCTVIDFSRVLQFTTISFDVSAQEIFSTLLAGGTLVLVDKETIHDISRLLTVVEKEKIKTVFWPASFLKFVMNEEDYIRRMPAGLRHIVTAGEQVVINERFKGYLQDGGVYLHNHYGPSETHAVTAWTWVPGQGGELPELPPIGRPISNTTIYIVDSGRNLVPVGTAGELSIGGIQVGRGYLNRPELTAEKFIEYRSYRSYRTYKLYKTGDLARWLEDGNIEFLGRIDQQVKIRGFRVELGEIESRLLNHPNIKDAVVLAREDKKTDKYLCAYVVLAEEPGPSELRAFLAEHLPGYMIPAYFVRMDRLPLTPNRKVDRRALPMPRLRTGKDYRAPRNNIERKLVKVWSEVLDIEREVIGIDSNFFTLGGHSLKATILTAKVHKEFQVKLPLEQVFKTPDIKGISQYIEKSVEHKHPYTYMYTAVKPVEKKEYYRLSSAQKRLFFLHRLEPHGTAYNMPEVIPLAREMSGGGLEQTFKHLIARHESLRTSFAMKGGKPVQGVHDHVEFEIEYLAAKNAKDRESDVRNFIKPFNLSRAPLMRVGMIEIKDDVHLLLVDMHHIIADGLSHGILVRDFTGLYQGKTLLPLRLQYKDYTEWQHTGLQTDELKQQEKYWLEVFAGDIPVLNLPTDYPRPAIQRFEGDFLSFEIDEERTELLRQIARQEEATLYMVLLTVYAVFLAKITGQEDIVIGTPIAGRRHADLDHIIGMFANTLALRNFPGGQKSFSCFLREVKTGTLNAFENQEYPFEELVEKLAVARDTGRNPLFDVMLALQSVEMGYATAAQTDQQQPDLKHRISKFDITLHCIHEGEKLQFFFEFCTKLFTRETIERFKFYFDKIISSVLQAPGIRLGQIEIISEKEKQKILCEFNDTGAGYARDKTIHELFAEQAEKTPDGVSLVGSRQLAVGKEERIQEPIQLTYRQLNEKSGQLAHLLREKGVGPDTVVALKIKRSIEMIIGILGILKAGGAYLPIDADYPQERIDYMMKDSQAGVLVSEVSKVSEVSGGAAAVTHPANLCYIIYTSGTTGKPKGVMLEHGNLVNLIRYQFNSTGIDFSRVLQFTTISFDVSAQEIFSTLLAGGTLVLVDKETIHDISRLLTVVEKEKIKTVFWPASFLKFVMNEEDYIRRMPAGLRHIVSAGEQVIINERFKGYLQDGGVYLHNHYGPSETHVVTAWTWVPGQGGELPELPPIGRPISNTTIYIVDSGQNLVPVGTAGELSIGGIQVGRGYLNRPELTNEKFDQDLWDYQDYRDENQKFLRGGPGGAVFSKSAPPGRRRHYKTGDLARWLVDGNIEFLGRIDRQVKIRGFRVELGEIESRLLNHDFIKEAVVVARQDERGGQYLCAYIGAGADKKISSSGLREYLGKDLPDYMIPAYFVQMDKIPLTASGKVDGKMLPRPGGAELCPDSSYAAPETNLQRMIAETWKEVLGRDKVGTRDNFFDLGGNSLDVITVSHKLKETLKKEIAVVTLFTYPTIGSLENYLNRQEGIENVEDGESGYSGLIDEGKGLMQQRLRKLDKED